MREPEDWDKQEYRIPRLFYFYKVYLLPNPGTLQAQKIRFAYEKNKTTLTRRAAPRGERGKRRGDYR